MSQSDNKTVELFKLYLGTAEKVSDRRASANSWMLSVNGAIVGLYGYLQSGKASVADADKAVWLLAIPAAAILACLSWAALLSSYRKLNSAKFKVLQDLEKSLAIPLFEREEHYYRLDGRKPLSWIESRVPWVFAALYLALIFAALI